MPQIPKVKTIREIGLSPTPQPAAIGPDPRLAQLGQLGLTLARFSKELVLQQRRLTLNEVSNKVAEDTAGLDDEVLEDTDNLANASNSFLDNFRARTDKVLNAIKDPATRNMATEGRDRVMAVQAAEVRRRAALEINKRLVRSAEANVSQAQLRFSRSETTAGRKMAVNDIHGINQSLREAGLITDDQLKNIQQATVGEAHRQRVVDLVTQDRFNDAQLHLDEFKPLMDADTVNRLQNLIENSTVQDQSELRKAITKEKAHARTFYEASASAGETLQRAKSTPGFEDEADDLQATLDNAPKIRAILGKRPDEQRAAIAEARIKDRPLTIKEGIFAEDLNVASTNFLRLLASDPLDAAQFTGVIEPLSDLNFEDPELLSKQFSRRESAADRVAEHYDLPEGSVPVLRRGEDDLIEAVLTGPNVANGVTVLEEMVEGLTVPAAERLALQILPKRPDLAVAIGAAALDDRGLATSILQGNRLLDARDFEFKKQDMRLAQADILGRAGEFVPDTQAAVIAAAQRVYAFERAKSGELGFDLDVYTEALETAMGGRFFHAGRRTFPPLPGVTGEQYRAILRFAGMEGVRQFSANQLLPVKTELSDDGTEFVQVPFELDDMMDAKLISIGNGVYRFGTGDPLELIVNENGDAFEMDVRGFVESFRGEAGEPLPEFLQGLFGIGPPPAGLPPGAAF